MFFLVAAYADQRAIAIVSKPKQSKRMLQESLPKEQHSGDLIGQRSQPKENTLALYE